MIQSPEVQQKIAGWRAKQAAGTMTPEDWKAAMEDLRVARSGAAAAAGRRKAAPLDVAALKASLLGGLRKT